MSSICNISKHLPYNTHFLATVIIPAGYTLISPADYYVQLTLNSHNLHTDTIYETKDSIIYLGRNSCNCPPQTMYCPSKVLTLLLHGPLYPNVAISKFKPVDPITQPSETTFTSSSVIPLDVTLGYVCSTCNLPLQDLLGYDTVVTHTPEFILTSTGDNPIFYNHSNPSPFFNALINPNDSRVLHIPYSITIYPSLI